MADGMMRRRPRRSELIKGANAATPAETFLDSVDPIGADVRGEMPSERCGERMG